MIAGWYDGNGRPTLKAMVIIEPIGVECVVDFLVDTGADLTCLHYPDVAVAGVDHGLLEEVSRPASMRGVGGSAEYRVVTSDVILDDLDTGPVFYRMPLLIAAEAQSGRLERPSLLGRDLLDRHMMLYDPRQDRLELRA